MIETMFEALMTLTEHELDQAIRQAETDQRAATARRSALLAVAEARQIHLTDGHHSIKGYLRATCNWSGSEIARNRTLATVTNAIPAVGDALLSGRIGIPQALEIAKAHANRRIGHLVAAIAPVLLEHAEHLRFDDFKIVVDRFVMLADLDGAFDEIAANLEHRTAHVTELGGTLDITATGGSPLTATKMISIFERFVQAEFHNDIETRRTEHGDQADQHPLPRTAAQRRFDALEAIFDTAAAAAGDAQQTADPLVNIIIDAHTLDEAFTRTGILLPNRNHLDIDELANATPIDALIDQIHNDPASLLERRCETTSGIAVHPLLVLQAALTGHVRRVIIDSAGVVTDLGRKQRLFTGSARIAAKLLTRRCSHPGCNITTTFADIDHIDEWAHHHGTTNQHNASIRCGKHDRFKHQHQWRTRRAPNGQHYTIKPDGTIILPVGEQPPDLTIDEHQHLARKRLVALTT
jgi:hypothetical protein